MWLHVFCCFKAYWIPCVSHCISIIYNSMSGSFQIFSVDLLYMFSAWCSYRCARTSIVMNLFWNPLQLIDYVDIQSLAVADVGLKFHEGLYHLVIQFCLDEWDTHRNPVCVLLSTSGTQYSFSSMQTGSTTGSSQRLCLIEQYSSHF